MDVVKPELDSLPARGTIISGLMDGAKGAGLKTRERNKDKAGIQCRHNKQSTNNKNKRK